MNKQETIASLQSEIQFAKWDIKPEALLALAMQKGLNMEDLVICCDQFMKREYSKDLYEAFIVEDVKKRTFLRLHLTRMGLYDQLPEGLFFQSPQRKSRQVTVNELADDYKSDKKREEDIRKFFIPFDNAFFLQRLKLEQEEASLLEGLGTGILNDYFIHFWGLDPNIPKMFLVPLVVLLPYAHKVAGDLDLTGRCLSFLLKEKVLVEQKKAKPSFADDNALCRLGEGQLGIDTVCGKEFFEDYPVFEIKIGPLKNSRIKEYLEGGKRHEVLETFNRFFIPAGVDTSVSIELEKEYSGMHEYRSAAYIEGDMTLERGAEPILGFSTVLG